MKKLAMFFFLGLTTAFATNVASAQDLTEAQVPQAVKSAFKAKYADSYAYEWEYERKYKEYEAEFSIDGVKYDAYFSPNGQWIRTERDIKKAQVPTVIYEAVRGSEFGTWEIDDIDELSTPQYAKVYRVEVEQGIREKYLYITPEGKIVEVRNRK